MITPRIEAELNKQVLSEAYSSQLYLSMAIWAETQGFEGVASFMFKHSDEERGHMLKLVKFINERGGTAVVPAIEAPPANWDRLLSVFQDLLDHEIKITHKINDLVKATLEEQDYTTQNFLQWYVSEQIEEEALARTILDKLKILGDTPGSGLYMFDRDVASISVVSANDAPLA